MLPTFLIAGAPRCGTTAMWRILQQHPDVHMSEPKEPHFFAETSIRDRAGPGDRLVDEAFVSSRAAYERLFDAATGARAVGEASTGYLYDPHSAAAIRATVPHATVIVLLRDPVDRAYSSYLFLRREGREPVADFLAAVEREPERRAAGYLPIWHYLAMSRYGEQLDRLLRSIPREQIQMVLYDDLVRDPAATVAGVCAAIGVDPAAALDLDGTHNASATPRSRRLMRTLRQPPRWARKTARVALPTQRLRRLATHTVLRANLTPPPSPPPQARARLVGAFEPDIRRVEELTGRDLASWRDVERPYLRAAGARERTGRRTAGRAT